MKKILLSIVLLIGILLSCGFQTAQELERKSGGYTESELVASGRVGVEGSDGTLFFSGFYKAPNGNYIPLNDNALMGQTIQPTSNPTKAENKKESAVSDSTNQQGLVEAEDKKDIQVVPLAEALETAGLVQMETEYATEILIYTIRERSNNSKDLEAVNSEEGKKRIETFLAGIDRMKNAENSELKGQEIAGISLYFSDDTNKDGVVGFSPAFLVKDQQTGEMKPYAFSQNSLDDNNKILNIIDLSAGGDGYKLECMEIDGQPTFIRKIEGVTEQYLDNAGEWKYYISEEMAKRFAEFDKHGCTDWKNPCPATVEDWQNRTLLLYAKSKATPFSSEMMNTEYGVQINEDSLAFTQNLKVDNGGVVELCAMNPPSKFVAHFSVKADGYFWQDYGLDITQNLNIGDPEKNNGFLIYQTLLTQPRDILFEKMGYTMPKRYDKSNNINPPAKGESMITDMAYYGADEINLLMDEWRETGIIPRGLENMILQPKIEYGDGSCFRLKD